MRQISVDSGELRKIDSTSRRTAVRSRDKERLRMQHGPPFFRGHSTSDRTWLGAMLRVALKRCPTIKVTGAP
jgi:hypothetical protein